MILIIDNYDSFVHNLARYVRECGQEAFVVRNDVITVEKCISLSPKGVIISPGPKRPADAGISMALLAELPAQTPFLGVCLGHQCLIEAFGGQTRRAQRPLHGEASDIRHDGRDIFQGISSPTPAGRYHSLCGVLVAPSPLRETAWSEEGEIMAVAHETRPWFGVQFHPESLLTLEGRKMIANFTRLCDDGSGP